MDRAIEYFQSFRSVATREDVRMAGAWAGKPQRRYASPNQYGSGEGPYVEVVDWRWDGVFESASPLVGLALLSVGERIFWAKSQPPGSRPGVSFSAHGWAADLDAVSFTGSFHGAFLPAVPVRLCDEPPASCFVGPSTTTTGTPHVVARIEDVVFAVLLLPASTVKVGRNRLWQLRESIASQLPPELRQLATRGRSGEVALVTALPSG